MGLTPVKRKTTTKDQLEQHSTGVHKKPNVEHLSTSHCTSTHMYGQGSASNNDKSLIEPSHDVASQLLTMGLTPAINDNDLLGCTHPHVYVDDKATSAVTEGFNVCLQSQHNYIMTSDFTEILTNSSDNTHSAPANCFELETTLDVTELEVGCPGKVESGDGSKEDDDFGVAHLELKSLTDFCKDTARAYNIMGYEMDKDKWKELGVAIWVTTLEFVYPCVVLCDGKVAVVGGNMTGCVGLGTRRWILLSAMVGGGRRVKNHKNNGELCSIDVL
ncbi:hypothetical protein Tco_0679774 [Tanacetum coccineum]|uniref:Uncharacterized protein n=1 Tax=Tanacetum coccineum TaxID=301880 RepID=A0ABQ4XJI5_9ASTR